MEEPLPTLDTALKLNLLEEEYERICQMLGRQPNFTELSAYSVMWSEHCSYKNSIAWLKTLPKSGPRILAEAGSENAGLVDIGGGYACSFKIESHNHPSAIQPYQGAATGVGGINRDVFTMGARPIAQLNSLRFGQLEDPHNQWLLRGVVKGIGDYGNSFGVPTVGGEVFFDHCYNVNPLVNAFSAGIVKVGETASAISQGAGNPVFIVGSATGKDGVHGATFASADIHEGSADDLPAVQVGDPFQEKLLLEASLEVLQTGKVVGMQDMGAAGIICSCSEMSEKGGHGMDVWLEKVPTRQPNMAPFELLLSESQERMLLVAEKGSEEAIRAVFDKWDLRCEEIGRVTEGNQLRYYMEGELVAELPADSLVLGGGAPVYHRAYQEPPYYREYQRFDPGKLQHPEDLRPAARYLLSQPNIASKRWVAEQYDSMVGTNNLSTNKSSDAAIVLVKQTGTGLAMSLDCNSRYINADPEMGAQIAVAEAARNIVCSGGDPVAITNCLNFGNPYNQHVYWQFVGTIKGMSRACEALQTPVTGGNVSFYNHSPDGGPVHPTPVIGMLGVLEDLSRQTSLAFQNDRDAIYLLGFPEEDLASSQYLYGYLEEKASPAPAFDLQQEIRLQQTVKSLIGEGLLQSAHDVSDGGLFVALAESGMAGGRGFSVERKSPTISPVAYWFGESQGRVVVSVGPQQEAAFRQYMEEQGQTAFARLGTVGGEDLVFGGDKWMSLGEAQELYEGALPAFMERD